MILKPLGAEEDAVVLSLAREKVELDINGGGGITDVEGGVEANDLGRATCGRGGVCSPSPEKKGFGDRPALKQAESELNSALDEIVAVSCRLNSPHDLVPASRDLFERLSLRSMKCDCKVCDSRPTNVAPTGLSSAKSALWSRFLILDGLLYDSSSKLR